MPIQWGDVATWVASIGTVGALSLALGQSLRQRKAENTRAHRDQADTISAWYSGKFRVAVNDSIIEDGVAINLSNSSPQLVYEVVVFQVFIQGAAPHTGEDWRRVGGSGDIERRAFVVLGALEPGRSSVKLPDLGGVMQGRLGAEIAFTDRHGTHWVRRSSGKLEQLDASPIEHFGIGRPVDYRNALPPYVDPRPV